MRPGSKRLLALPPFRRFLCWHGPRRGAAAALTFDDGPTSGATPRVLEILAAAGVRATFFVLGKRVAEDPVLVRAIAAAGHEIGIHGFDHGRRAFPAQARQCAAALRAACGPDAGRASGRPSLKLVRPPRGELSLRAALWLALRGCRIVLWSLDARDSMRHEGWWAGGAPDYEQLRAGDIVLMHDDNPVCVAELPDAIAAARRKGLSLVTVSELVRGGAASKAQST